jgi:hypothetical protein
MAVLGTSGSARRRVIRRPGTIVVAIALIGLQGGCTLSNDALISSDAPLPCADQGASSGPGDQGVCAFQTNRPTVQFGRSELTGLR